MCTKLYVGNVSDHTKEKDLKEVFQAFGDVSEVAVLRGYGFVHFHNADDATAAVDALDNSELCGARLQVQYSRTKGHGYSRGNGRPRDTSRGGNYRSSGRSYDSRRDNYRDDGYRRDNYRDGGSYRDSYRDGGSSRDSYRDGGSSRDSYRDGGSSRDNYRDVGSSRYSYKDGGSYRDSYKDGGSSRDSYRDGSSFRDKESSHRDRERDSSRRYEVGSRDYLSSSRYGDKDHDRYDSSLLDIYDSRGSGGKPSSYRRSRSPLYTSSSKDRSYERDKDRDSYQDSYKDRDGYKEDGYHRDKDRD